MMLDFLLVFGDMYRLTGSVCHGKRLFMQHARFGVSRLVDPFTVRPHLFPSKEEC